MPVTAVFVKINIWPIFHLIKSVDFTKILVKLHFLKIFCAKNLLDLIKKITFVVNFNENQCPETCWIHKNYLTN
jgi:hypothetical protein